MCADVSVSHNPYSPQEAILSPDATWTDRELVSWFAYLFAEKGLRDDLAYGLKVQENDSDEYKRHIACFWMLMEITNEATRRSEERAEADRRRDGEGA